MAPDTVLSNCVPPVHPLLPPSSPQDSRLYLVFPHDSSALSNSFYHLQLFDQDSSNVVSVSLLSTGPGRAGVGQGETQVGSPDLHPCPQRFLQDPYSTTFSSFSRVTNFFRGALQPHPEGASSPDLRPPPDDEPGFEVISCVSIKWTLPVIFWLCHLGRGSHLPGPLFPPW